MTISEKSANAIITYLNKVIETLETNPELEYSEDDESMMLEYNGCMMDIKEVCGHIINHIEEKITLKSN